METGKAKYWFRPIDPIETVVDGEIVIEDLQLVGEYPQKGRFPKLALRATFSSEQAIRMQNFQRKLKQIYKAKILSIILYRTHRQIFPNQD
jgi:hypothetical protein